MAKLCVIRKLINKWLSLTVSPEAVSPVLGPELPALVTAVPGHSTRPRDPPWRAGAGLACAVATAGADPPPVLALRKKSPGLFWLRIYVCHSVSVSRSHALGTQKVMQMAQLEKTFDFSISIHDDFYYFSVRISHKWSS